jgi:hypothetical protein
LSPCSPPPAPRFTLATTTLLTAKPDSRMKTNTGLNDETRLEVGQILNLVLADEFVLYATTRDYHWNVTGPEFRSLHRQFEEQ